MPTHAGPVFPLPAAAGAAPLAQAAGGDDAQEPAAAPRGRLAAGRIRRGPLSAGDCPTPASPTKTGATACCCAAARSITSWQRRREELGRERRGDPAARAALSALRAAARRCSARIADGTPVCWVQEEPENMGAWRLPAGAASASGCSAAVRSTACIAGPRRPARPPARPAATGSNSRR